MSKWYIGKTSTEIVGKMDSISKDIIDRANRGQYSQSEMLYDQFLEMLDQVIPVIVDMKTEFYMHNKEVWNDWNNCKHDLGVIKRELESKLEKIFS